MTYTSREHEFSVLKELESTKLPVPRVHWMEPAGSALERPYMVMDRMRGEPMGRESPGTRRSIGGQLGALLARLHSTHVTGSSAVEATRAEVSAWRQRYLELSPYRLPVMDALLAWLDVNLPALEGPAVRLWGDPGPHNILVHNGRITALLDWEMAHSGHPLDDLGVAVWSCLGLLDPESVIEGYEHASGRPVDRDQLDYFEVLATVSRAVTVMAGALAFADGRIHSPAQAGLGLELVRATLVRAAQVAGWPAPLSPPPAKRAPSTPLLPTPGQTLDGVARLLLGEIRPALTDRRLARMTRNAAALLEASALRQAAQPALHRWLERKESRLLADLAAAGVPGNDLAAAAAAVEADAAYAPIRTRVRRFLVTQLNAEFAGFEPLRRLYGESASAPPLRKKAPS
jgi:aminoglycoside phosphotransferase (APT) family kinase protein